MALWTPYADNVALDLSKSTEEEKKIPRPELKSQDVYHFGYKYVSAPQLSPLAGASLYSYERPFTPNIIPTLSPPISPGSSGRRPFSLIDDSLSDDPDFQAFERDALRVMAEKNGGTLLGDNPRMRRAVGSNSETNNDSYRKQRERNNFAAKQSRDRRKLREIHLALKVSYLKKEIVGLKSLLASRICCRCHQSCRF